MSDPRIQVQGGILNEEEEKAVIEVVDKYKDIDFKKWDYCMRDVEDNGLGFGKVLDYINVKWGKDDPNDFKLNGF